MLAWFSGIPTFFQIAVIYFAAINAWAFFYFGWDKLKAQSGLRRISEKKLWFISLLGGSLGAYMAMNFFRHKTKKASFQAVFLLIFLLQITIIFLLLQQ